MIGIGAFRVFMRIRLNIEPYFPLKPTKVGFIFIGPNSLSRAEDLAASCQSRDTSCRQSWVEDWVLKSGLRNYGSSRSFKSRAQENKLCIFGKTVFSVKIINVSVEKI